MSSSRPGTPTSAENIVQHARQSSDGDSTLIGHALTAVSGPNVTAFSRTVTATAATLIGPLGDSITSSSNHYQHAMSDISKELRRPSLQRRVFTFAQRTPTELVRSKLSTSEIQHKALTYLPEELLRNIPDNENTYSLFQGFQATLPDVASTRKRRGSTHRKMLEDSDAESNGASSASVAKLTKERANLTHQLEMFSIRKNMCSSEIREIDMKIVNLNAMRHIVLERLAKLEQEEAQLEHEILEVDNKIDDIQEELESLHLETENDSDSPASNAGSEFMSESIYGKLSNSSKAPKKRRSKKRLSMPILHEHFDPGTNIIEIQTHADSITSLDFDVPFGTLVTAALDDTIRVWDLSNGRCLGMLEGHNASVRCLQVEDNIVATGSMDATIRLWDLSRAEHYRNATPGSSLHKKGYNGEDADDEHTDDGQRSTISTGISSPHGHISLNDCSVFSLDAHVDEITALYFQGDTLVSGSADKTLRQWDLQKGRCVQTLDVLWAAAQTSATSSDDPRWRIPGRTPDVKADFVGALQCFDAALACGTADGMVRLWDLRSGQVHRSLVGHTGPITCLQFDDVYLVTGSLDRSIRIWDLRTGSIFDAYGYDNPITSMQFDSRRIVSAAGEPVVKIYDKADSRHWDCGAGARADDGGEAREKSIVCKVRIMDGYLVEGRKDGMVGVWAC